MQKEKQKKRGGMKLMEGLGLGLGLMCNSSAICMSHEEINNNNNNNNYVRLRDHRSINSSSINHQHNSSLPPAVLSSHHQHHLFQVVVMRVSIHCQGCAAKLNKHLSKMQGVTSFSIDLETKKVTVKGHVSPSGVLQSISKINKAEFWPCS